VRISIDPNVRTAGNQTFTGFGDLFGEVDELHEGDYLLAMGLETDFVWDSKVTRIDHERKLIYLEVAWRSGRPDIKALKA
jgi:hypothetical protein